MEPPPSRTHTASRPRAALAFLIAPIVAGILLGIATLGWFWTVHHTDGEARGEWARVTFDAPCDVDAAIAARLDDLGLDHRREDGAWVLHLPGMDDDLSHVPEVLARQGLLEVSVDGAPQKATIANVGVQLAFSGTPITLVSLFEAIPERGLVEARIDGERVEIELATGQELQIASRAADSVTALRTATERAVALRHPLSCVATVANAELLH